MLKEVGASGQISLGKKYAGQLFEVQTAPDGTITLQPVKVVPAPPHRTGRARPLRRHVNQRRWLAHTRAPGAPRSCRRTLPG